MGSELATNPEYKKIEQEGSALEIKAASIQIVDDGTRIDAAEALKGVSVRVTQVEALTEPPWRSALTAYEEVQQWRKDLIARFVGPKKAIAAKIGAYDMMVADRRRKEAEKAEAEDRKRAEEVRAAEIAAAKKAKDKDAVKALRSAPLDVMPTAPTTQEPTKAGVSSRFEWKLEVIFSPSSVPREYCEPSEKIIKERIKRLGGAHGIPGVRAIQVPIVRGS